MQHSGISRLNQTKDMSSSTTLTTEHKTKLEFLALRPIISTNTTKLQHKNLEKKKQDKIQGTSRRGTQELKNVMEIH